MWEGDPKCWQGHWARSGGPFRALELDQNRDSGALRVFLPAAQEWPVLVVPDFLLMTWPGAVGGGSHRPHPPCSCPPRSVGTHAWRPGCCGDSARPTHPFRATSGLESVRWEEPGLQSGQRLSPGPGPAAHKRPPVPRSLGAAGPGLGGGHLGSGRLAWVPAPLLPSSSLPSAPARLCPLQVSRANG